MIRINNLSKTYKSSNTKAVDDISLEVKAGEIFGFLGPNGAGKSTTIKCITGILPYEQGHISICGHDLKDNPVEAKSKIGYVADENILYDGLTGLEYINFIADVFNVESNVRKERIEKYAKTFDMHDKLAQRISSYSHGMKQKISIISALVHQPEVWILDEPMTGLDPKSSFALKQLMNEHISKGNVVFFSSHVLEVVEKLCTKIAIINKGKLVTVCDMKELKAKREDLSLEELFLGLTNEIEANNDDDKTII
ncbi:MAG: ABC transporter ATP-binding protein [Clostridiales bacterium]|nr:ABC transporter ATP-binding protein [Clostridiales bacterium]